MLREGRHVKKTSDAAKLRVVVFIVFSIIFLEKLMQHRAKKHGKRLCAQNSTKDPRLERTFLPKRQVVVDVCPIWVPRGLPGRPRRLLESFRGAVREVVH